MNGYGNLVTKTENIFKTNDSKIDFVNGLIISSYKIGVDRERLEKYLAGQNIYPISVEFDLTDKCNRSCPGCPSVKASAKHFLSKVFIERILAILQGHAYGLLLTGGEPTIAPLFCETLKIGKKRGFREISVVSNGKCLNDPKVVAALLENVTSLRISLYDWEEGVNGPLGETLKNIGELREFVEQEGSNLSIGVSILTHKGRTKELETMVRVLSDSGAHWVYFHPMCENWDLGRPVIMDQTGVFEEIMRVRKAYAKVIPVLAGEERYKKDKLEFSSYHAANFLLVIGADGKNYLSPETKYNPQYVLADLGDIPSDNFLWQAERRKAMSYSSSDYACIGSRHRSILYNSVIEGLKNGREQIDQVSSIAGKLIHPYIL